MDKQYDSFSIDGLKHSIVSKKWTVEECFELVSKVLTGNSYISVVNEALINQGQLYLWVKRYNEKGIEGLQLKRGRPSEATVKKTKKPKLSISEAEELKLLKERNLYLEAENEYLKN